MPQIALSRVSWMVAIVAASLSCALSSRAQAQSADELLALAANRPLPHGTAKPDGSRFTTSAARFADVKREIRVTPTASKRDDSRPFADQALPIWLRLSSAASEDESLRDVPEVGLRKLKSSSDLDSLFARVSRRRGDDYLRALETVGKAQIDGLSFRDAKARKLNEKQSAALSWTSATLRTILAAQSVARQNALAKSQPLARPYALSAFFRDFNWLTVQSFRVAEQKGAVLEELDIRYADTASSAVLPGLMQVLAVQAPEYRLELVRQLRTEALGDDAGTAALVRLALLDDDAQVRREAPLSLQVEPRDKVGRQLLAGFRYPWHIVAERAAQAIVALDRTDLLPALVDLLEEEDPTAPFERTVEGRKELAVREVVKLNHNQNCLVCHASAAADAPRQVDELFALVPSPEDPLQPPESRYGTGIGPTIRVTDIYLRQDFSKLEKVENPGEWPELQRFDYLVRTRTATAGETKTRRWVANESRAPSPNRRAVLYALTRLTSVYAGTDSDAWRPAVASFLAANPKPGR